MKRSIMKKLLTLSIIAAAFIALPMGAGAMHIMEGYIPVGYSIAWGVVSIPFLVVGTNRLKKIFADNRRSVMLLAMAGAFIFVISSLKIPSVTGSCSHMTGTGLAAMLFGVGTTSILAIIVLIFQASLLAHGGYTTLGANTFSMGIAGPLLTWLLFKAGKKMKINRMANAFIASSLGGLFTYCVTAFQLALAHPSEIGGVAASFNQFIFVFAPTQIPLAIVEGLLTVLILMGMESYASRELAEISFMEA
ncbi:MAG: energy-coupling factor ABC transporter permease [Oscillospiraceae bacterium]|nr:energy-coupling factor ABC transporter permease [Oscillospiraceae bacterium]